MRLLGPVALSVYLAACPGPKKPVVVTGVQSDRFTMSVLPTAITSLPGTNAVITVLVTRLTGDFTTVGEILLTLDEAPDGVAASGSIPASLDRSELKLAIAQSMPAGLYDIHVRASGGDAAVVQVVQLTVLDPAAFGISVDPAVADLAPSDSTTIDVAINRGTSLTGDVTLSVDGLPSGVTASFLPDATTGDASVLTLTASASAAAGTSVLTVRGKNAGAPDSLATLALTISSAPLTCDDACVAGPPNGFAGPIAVAVGASFAACGSGFPVASLGAYSSLAYAPASCTCPCTVGNINCGGPVIESWSGGSCGSMGSSNPFGNYGTCIDASGLGQPSRKASIGAPSGGSCDTTPSKSTQSATFDFVRGCGGTFAQRDCASGELCVPSAPVGFGAKLCVFAPGDVGCAGPYTQKTLYDDAYSDNRGCSACTCGAPTALTCTSTFHIFDDTTCTTQREAVTATSAGSSQCFAMFSRFRADPPVATGSCSQTGGGMPTGAVTPTSVTTVCCLP